MAGIAGADIDEEADMDVDVGIEGGGTWGLSVSKKIKSSGIGSNLS